ncbi:MAG: hypothetical protein FWG82_02775 [Oscillospiraceae bacterium]|nr:hypothetical protein [Oscillospiraceae bacterium]
MGDYVKEIFSAIFEWFADFGVGEWFEKVWDALILAVGKVFYDGEREFDIDEIVKGGEEGGELE